jgi:hypothetical protein
MTKTIVALLLLASLSYASPASVLAIDKFVSSTFTVLAIQLNATGNASVNYGTSTALGTFKNSSIYKPYHNILFQNLSQNTTYYFQVTACDNANNCTNNTIDTMNTTALTNTLSQPSSIDLMLLIFLLALGFGLAIFGWKANDLLTLLIAVTLNFITGYYLFTGFNISYGLATGQVALVHYSNFYIQTFGFALIVLSFYLIIRAFGLIMKFITARRGEPPEPTLRDIYETT